jgi:hypothetical protein
VENLKYVVGWQVLAAERKAAKVESEEADKVQKLEQQLEDRVIELELFKLYHLDTEIKESQVKRQSVELELKQTVCITNLFICCVHIILCQTIVDAVIVLYQSPSI